ncbi:Gibberellin-regulated protein 6 [Dichanthelium oligosanthes]|uniref:Gibberellin-regulated protein 6 n=1 Tax=Dichanthelium oligosanthes TaxID=888268 RepID=A0A1E5VWD9_9POAL|nr:Gibberellin-regulated protein 6 [Dichanthelium oligosanthes]
MANRALVPLLLCFFFLLALASAQIVDCGVADEDLSKGDDIDHHKGNNDGKGNLKPSQCGGEFRRRCSKTHHKKPCLLFCNKCCAKCLCVPPGTYGNKNTCPCYDNWKTKKGGPKCP